MFEISKKIEKAVEAIVKPIIISNGYEYVGIEIKKTASHKELIIYADKPGGLSLDDCEKISRLIDPAIDEKDPIEDAYYLCVSSPGLDRALKEPADFARSIGKQIDVKLYRAVDGQKEFTGELCGYNESGFTLVIKGNEKLFSYKDTAIVKLHVDI
ncbi:MAG: ribosome maturation factor RimP [Christensenellales bacterium]